MQKTITIRIDNAIYDIFKKAAEGQKRTISNYMEYAALNYTINESIVDDEEMQEILEFEKDLKKGLSDISAGRYKIAETAAFEKKIKSKKYEFLYQKIKNYVYPILRKNPHFGPNIKKLKGIYKEIYRFRLGDFRLFYKVSEEKIIVFIIDIEARKDAYK